MLVFCIDVFFLLLLSSLIRCKCVNGTSSQYHFSFTFTNITTFLSFIYFDLCCLCLPVSIFHLSRSLTTLSIPIIPFCVSIFLLFTLIHFYYSANVCCYVNYLMLKRIQRDSSQSNVKNYCIRFVLCCVVNFRYLCCFN